MDPEGNPTGMTMSAVTSLSLDPPQFLVCMDHRAATLAAIRHSKHFCINYLSEEQEHLSNLFAQRAHVDKFAGVGYHSGEMGDPVLDGSIAHVECELAAIQDGGDHGIVIGNAMHGEAPGGRPLGYFHGAYRRLPEEEEI